MVVNVGDYWEAMIDGSTRLVQIKGTYNWTTRTMTVKESQDYIAEFGDQYMGDDILIGEDDEWLYGKWQEGLEDVPRD